MKYEDTSFQKYFQNISHDIKRQLDDTWICALCWEKKDPSTLVCEFCKNKNGYFVKYKVDTGESPKYTKHHFRLFLMILPINILEKNKINLQNFGRTYFA